MFLHSSTNQVSFTNFFALFLLYSSSCFPPSGDNAEVEYTYSCVAGNYLWLHSAEAHLCFIQKKGPPNLKHLNLTLKTGQIPSYLNI